MPNSTCYPYGQTTFAAPNFAKAASELQEKLYAFEVEWNSKVFKKNGTQIDVLTDARQKSLEEGFTQTREIVRKQREAYFMASAPLSIDIMGVLEPAKTNAYPLYKFIPIEKLEFFR